MFFALIFASHSSTPVPMKPSFKPFHFQAFNDDTWEKKWVVTTLDNYSGRWWLRDMKGATTFPGEKMITMSNTQAYYGLSTKFDKPLDVTNKTLIVQYEVRFEDFLHCGGAYIKLFGLDSNFNPSILSNETRYTIMFGPDKCGESNKVHFIFKHLNPLTGEYEEKHMTDAPKIKDDKLTHQYTLIIRPNNSFEVLIDGISERSGNLLFDFDPPVNPPKYILDETDIKPADWVEEEYIEDPNAFKPDGWDETQPEYIIDEERINPPNGWLLNEPQWIPDLNAKKPSTWEDDLHGTWHPPAITNPKCLRAPGCGEYEPHLIKNPKYVGPWIRPMIKNPAYKGPWKQRKVLNPNYYEDLRPHNFQPLVGVGFELWMVNKDVGFGNVLVDTDEKNVKEWIKVHFEPKHELQDKHQKSLDKNPNLEAEEQKQNERRAKKYRKHPENIQESIQQFVESLNEAWDALYKDNPQLATGIAGFILFILFIIFIMVSCRSPPPPPPRSHRKKKRQQQKMEEEKNTQEEKPENKENDKKEEKESEANESDKFKTE